MTPVRTFTTPEDKLRIDNAFYAIAEYGGYLAGRWSDEGQYKDINAYRVALQMKLPEGFKITKMKKRPFGCEFEIGNGNLYYFSFDSHSCRRGRVS